MNGKRYLRVTIMNDLTTAQHLSALLDEIERVGENIVLQSS